MQLNYFIYFIVFLRVGLKMNFKVARAIIDIPINTTIIKYAIIIVY